MQFNIKPYIAHLITLSFIKAADKLWRNGNNCWNKLKNSQETRSSSNQWSVPRVDWKLDTSSSRYRLSVWKNVFVLIWVIWLNPVNVSPDSCAMLEDLSVTFYVILILMSWLHLTILGIIQRLQGVILFNFSYSR